MRGSAVSTGAVTKFAKAMLVMKRPRFSTCSVGSSPSFHSAMLIFPLSMPVSYPITPQTIIVEKLAEFVATGKFSGEFIAVESEHSALSACLGASATGARVFTATSSQGLAYMHEMLYNASGMRLPIVMAVANRALSAPLVLNADHSDMMGSRDSGWIQVYAENVEEIYDRTIQLFRLSEDPRVMLPSAINFEGFILSHDKERVRLLEDGPIRKFLGRPTTKHRLDPKEPFTFGAIATPDTYYEFRMQQAEAMRNALAVFEETEREFEAFSGRRYGAVDAYNTEGADRVVVVNGCTAGTMRAAARAMNAGGENVGVLAIKLYRPFPTEEVVSQTQRGEVGHDHGQEHQPWSPLRSRRGGRQVGSEGSGN